MKDKEPHICCHDQVYRRGVLKYALGFGGALIGRSLLNRLVLADSLSNPIDPLTAAVSEEISYLHAELTNLGLDDPTGRIITRAKREDDTGNLRVTYEKLDLVKEVKDDLFRPSHRLKILSERGYDLYMDYGSTQGASRIPLPQAEPIDTPSYISDILLGMGSIFGREYYLTGIGEYDLYKTYRIADDEGDTFAIQEMLDGPKAGTITLATIAPYFFDAGLIPQKDILPVVSVEPVPTPTPLIFPRYPQIPLPTPDPSYTKRPSVKGDQDCLNQSNLALDLLKARLPSEYYLSIFYTGLIECTETGNGHALPGANPPTIQIPKLLRTDRIVLSGAIVHESCHLWQFRRFKEMYPGVSTPPGIGSGKDAEEECYNIEYQTQKKLGDHPENLKLFREFVYQRFGIVIYNP